MISIHLIAEIEATVVHSYLNRMNESNYFSLNLIIILHLIKIHHFNIKKRNPWLYFANYISAPSQRCFNTGVNVFADCIQI